MMRRFLIVCLTIIFFAGLNHIPVQASSSDGIESLIKALSSDDARTRGEAAKALGNKGIEAKDAVPMLIKILDDDHPRVTGESAGAIGEILGWSWDGEPQNYGLHVDDAVDGLIKTLKHPFTVVRTMAALSLGKMGPNAIAAVPALKELINDGDTSVSNAAKTSLQIIQDKYLDQ